MRQRRTTFGRGDERKRKLRSLEDPYRRSSRWGGIGRIAGFIVVIVKEYEIDQCETESVPQGQKELDADAWLQSSFFRRDPDSPPSGMHLALRARLAMVAPPRTTYLTSPVCRFLFRISQPLSVFPFFRPRNQSSSSKASFAFRSIPLPTRSFFCNRFLPTYSYMVLRSPRLEWTCKRFILGSVATDVQHVAIRETFERRYYLSSHLLVVRGRSSSCRIFNKTRNLLHPHRSMAIRRLDCLPSEVCHCETYNSSLRGPSLRDSSAECRSYIAG